MSAPALSIVVPTYNRRRILSRTLPTLLGQRVEGEGYEVIVVVDGSTDGTQSMLEGSQWGSRLRVLRQPNRGQGPARNRGAAEARGRILLFLDDDMMVPPDLVAVHLHEHGRSDRRAILGRMGLATGVRRSFLKAGVERWGSELAERASDAGYHVQFDDWHSGHASVTRSLFLEAGGFDETFAAYGNEDYDLGWRLMQRGVEMRFSARALAWQIYDKSFPQWLRDVRCVGRADVTLAAKHPTMASRLRLARPPAHRVKRLARWSGLASIDPLAPAWAALAASLSVAEWLSLNGTLLGHAQSLMGERAYWRGVRDARRPAQVARAAAIDRPGRAA